MKNVLKIATVFLLITISGCGNSSDDQSRTSIKSLEELMENNPELKKATLEQIKTAASPSKTKWFVGSLKLLLDDSPWSDDLASLPPENLTGADRQAAQAETPALNPGVAKNAQKLIDEILDAYSIKKEFDASFKIFAIILKTEKAMMKDAMDIGIALSRKKGGMDDKIFEDEKFNDESNPLNMKCEDVAAGNFGGIPLNKMGDILEANKLQLKKSLSGCAKIHGEKFVSCMKGSIDQTTIINDHVTCDLKDINEMQTVLEEKTQMSFTQLNDRKKECENIFNKCGYTPDKTEAILDKSQR